jgi:hypothetical protein
MATDTPPPYFPQGSLSPPDQNRYRKFKLIVVAVVAGIAVLLAVVGLAAWYLIKALF